MYKKQFMHQKKYHFVVRIFLSLSHTICCLSFNFFTKLKKLNDIMLYHAYIGGWSWAWSNSGWPNRWNPWQHQSSGGMSTTGGHRGSSSNRGGGTWGGSSSSQRSWHTTRTNPKFTRYGLLLLHYITLFYFFFIDYHLFGQEDNEWLERKRLKLCKE